MPTTAYVTQNGDIIKWEIPVTNNGTATDNNVVVQGVVPNGVSYISHQAPAGTTFTFNPNPTPSVWNVGTLAPGETKTLIIYTSVADINQAPFTWQWTVSGDNVDPNAGNNVLTLTVNTATCPPQAGAVDDVGCTCGNVSLNDTPCSHCDTTYEYEPASLNNVTMVHWDSQTGQYIVQLVDPYQPGSFQYSIWCRNCPDGNDYETSGPAVVTIQPLLGPNHTCKLEEVSPGLMKHTALDGTVVTFKRGWTTVELVGTDLVFTYPDGTVVTIPTNATCPCTLTDNGNGTYTFDNGIVNITFKAGWTEVTDNGNGTWTITYPDVTSQTLTIDVPSTMTDNGDGTHTYTDETGATTVIGTRFKDRVVYYYSGLNAGSGNTITVPIPLPPGQYVDVYRNRLIQVEGVDYTIVGANQIQFTINFGGILNSNSDEDVVVKILLPA